MKSLITHFLTALLFVFSIPIARSQTLIPPIGSEIYFGPKTDLNSISCDIIKCPRTSTTGGGYLYAIAYTSIDSGVQTGTVKVFHTASGLSKTYSVPGAKQIDVALGDAQSAPGTTYICFWTYTQDSAGYEMVKYSKASMMPTATTFFDNLAGNRRIAFGHNPKVDVFPIWGNNITGTTVPKMHDMVITWSEDDDSLHAAFGYINTIPTNYAFAMPAPVMLANVTAQYDVASSKYVAHFGAYTVGSSSSRSLYRTSVDFTSSTPTVLSTAQLASNPAVIADISMESPGVHSNTLGGAKWGMVTQSFNNEIMHYNSIDTTGYSLSGNTAKGTSPCITAGIGFVSDTNKIGNKYFTPGWINCSNVFTQQVDRRTGKRPFSPFYYVANDTSVANYLAMASTTNTGDTIMTTWYDGANIWYKFSNSIPTASVPAWPATTPSLTDKVIWRSDTSGRIDWVNTDRFNLYLTNDNSTKGYLQAVANDFYDSTLGTYKIVINVYSSITNTVRTLTVNNARHPDIQLFDDRPDSLALVDTPNYHLVYAYENLSASPTEIYIRSYEINNPFDDAKFSITENSSTPYPVGSSGYAKSSPHIDAITNETPSIYPFPQTYGVSITWAESDGSIKVKNANITDNITTQPIYTIGYGVNPDVAQTVGNNYHYGYHTYYDPTNYKLICKKYDASSGTYPLIDSFILDSAIVITGLPRIEAFNRLPGSDDVEWVVVAEVQNGTNSEVREYRGGICDFYTTNYSTAPISNGTTISTSNNPLYNNNGYSPCVAAGSGPETYSNPTSLGNSNYTLGWWIAGSQYNALTVAATGFQDVSGGYARINTNSVNPGVVTSGQSKLALANGSNDGVGIAAAWVADTALGPMIVIKQSPTLSFKPASVKGSVSDKGLIIYPNPANDRLYVADRLMQSYTISDLTGKAIIRGIVAADGIGLRSLTPGVYLIAISDVRGHVNHAKFIKE
ncbi:MAG: T9SS type A sorting domain-containing protein [Sphingobacteriales bacterium]|nr:MAG: T9SS type A sorting domain-containing protein [Sphingobacteriales bacterium]